MKRDRGVKEQRVRDFEDADRFGYDEESSMQYEPSSNRGPDSRDKKERSYGRAAAYDDEDAYGQEEESLEKPRNRSGPSKRQDAKDFRGRHRRDAGSVHSSEYGGENAGDDSHQFQSNRRADARLDRQQKARGRVVTDEDSGESPTRNQRRNGDYDDEDDIAGFEDDMPSDGDGDERPSGP